jgi:hypothetical protein
MFLTSFGEWEHPCLRTRIAWWLERPEVICKSWEAKAGSGARGFPRRRDATGPVRDGRSLEMLSLAREQMNPGLFAISSMSARDPGAIPASRREARVTKS